MLTIASAGDRAGAIALYRELVRKLDDELGVRPLDETLSVYEGVRRGSPHSAPPASPIRRAFGDQRADALGRPRRRTRPDRRSAPEEIADRRHRRSRIRPDVGASNLGEPTQRGGHRRVTRVRSRWSWRRLGMGRTTDRIPARSSCSSGWRRSRSRSQRRPRDRRRRPRRPEVDHVPHLRTASPRAIPVHDRCLGVPRSGPDLDGVGPPGRGRTGSVGRPRSISAASAPST